MSETYRVEYRDARDRWHRRRGTFTLASAALSWARDVGQRCDVHGWRVLDAQGRVVADHLGRGVARGER